MTCTACTGNDKEWDNKKLKRYQFFCRWTPFCTLFSDKHSGENIAAVVDLDMTDKLDLPTSLPKWGVADNASNMVKGLNLSVADLYTCLCHTQQLAIG